MSRGAEAFSWYAESRHAVELEAAHQGGPGCEQVVNKSEQAEFGARSQGLSLQDQVGVLE